MNGKKTLVIDDEFWSDLAEWCDNNDLSLGASAELNQIIDKYTEKARGK